MTNSMSTGKPSTAKIPMLVAASVAPVGNYTVELIDLQPYPLSTKKILMKEYVARVTIGLNYDSEGVQELKKVP